MNLLLLFTFTRPLTVFVIVSSFMLILLPESSAKAKKGAKVTAAAATTATGNVTNAWATTTTSTSATSRYPFTLYWYDVKCVVLMFFFLMVCTVLHEYFRYIYS